ncbi:hypothetical protein [Legionella maceachernii]|uniref:hypothetical protein n=1 Tax=Legionella maceachernii TaxID=466 RepID=UPI001358605C|nr:hypothetical protein [Legionella maceachernii]
MVVPNVVRDLLGGVTAKSREVLRFAQDDSGVVVPSVVRDLLGKGYCQESGGPSLCSG